MIDYKSKLIAEVQKEHARMPNGDAEHVPGLARSLGDILNANEPAPEVIALDTPRGAICVVNAVVNAGKSTFLRNLALTIASGGEMRGIVATGARARRVLYIDGETHSGILRADLARMLDGMTERERAIARDNLYIIADAEVNGTPLRLPDHIAEIEAEIAAREPDIVILDTLSALFSLWNENDAAEVARKFTGPVRHLARKYGAAIVVAHHVGKAIEHEMSEPAYRGRGSSAIAAGESVWLLTRDQYDERRVKAQCVKRKTGDGTRYEIMMRLDQVSRWFYAEQMETTSPIKTFRDLIIEALERFGDTDVTTGDIHTAIIRYAPDSSYKRVQRALTELLAEGRVQRYKQRYWRLRQPESVVDPELGF